ncbi:hypothetical protein F3Y22_tig00110821pilonHSYRG00008 [Hibiscus syriacus]|uniref:Transcription repressor n=1 Tax=Hibiscus syriacus TaxID=106335 RepID=A0A6A2ZLN1_HIBSY|nr:hypothetical protein F3Y22_tig00110821pilonHSYRG00008 [Hibiscus syriacus]
MDPPSFLYGSNRFFVSTGLSSSLVDDARSSGTNSTMSISENLGSTSTSSASINNTVVSNDSNSTGGDGVVVESLSNIRNECIAVVTYSHNPYDDFRRSLQEMVEARMNHHSEIDWDFMEELVFCYLNLNNKKSYKFILSAFVDLVVDLRQNHTKIPPKSRHFMVNDETNHKKSRSKQDRRESCSQSNKDRMEEPKKDSDKLVWDQIQMRSPSGNPLVH